MSTPFRSFRYLPLWKRESNYVGPDFSDHYVLYSIFPEADDLLAQSNYDSLKEHFNFHIVEHHFRHWTYPWLSVLMFPPETPLDTLLEADDILKELSEDWPIFDDSDYYEREANLIFDNWTDWGRNDLLGEFTDQIEQTFPEDFACELTELFHFSSANRELLGELLGEKNCIYGTVEAGSSVYFETLPELSPSEILWYIDTIFKTSYRTPSLYELEIAGQYIIFPNLPSINPLPNLI